MFFFWARLSRAFWFMPFGPVFSSPCSFLPIVPGEGFFIGQGQRVVNLGIAGQTVVGGFGLHGRCSSQWSLVPNTMSQIVTYKDCFT